MKRNKYIKPGILIAVVLLCAGVFAAYMLTRAPVEPQPLPVDIADTDVSQNTPAPSPLPVAVDWKSGIPDKTETDTPDSIETFPKVESEEPDTVVINFTDPDKGKTTPPPAPDSEPDSATTAPATSTPAPVVTATPAPAATSKPAPKPAVTPKPKKEDTSGTRSDGAVYDDVFGWVIPGESVGIPAHSDGDINKQVGSMGGD